MKRTYRLYLRNGMYYVRFIVPKSIISLVGKRIIRYSLGTRDFNKALIRLNIESAAFDGFVEGLEQMRIEKDKLYLSDNDLHAFILARMEDVYERYTHYRGGIVAKHFGYDAVKWFDADNDDRKTAWSKIENRYAKYLLNEAKHNSQFADIANKLNTGEIHFASITSKNEENQEHKQWGDHLYRVLRRIEYHTQQMFDSIVNNQPYTEQDGYINDLIETVRNRKNSKLVEAQTEIELDWKVVWKDLRKSKETGRKTVRPKTLDTMDTRLNKIFSILGKSNLHQITDEDAKNLRKQLLEMKKTDGKFYGERALNGYISHYNEIINYAVDNFKLKECHLLKFLPKKEIKKEEKPRIPFTEQVLIKIFSNKDYLKKRYNFADCPKFWIPLIALYSGARLSEISQLKISDVFKDTNIGKYCLKITTLDEKGNQVKDLKTKNAKRIVPIHPKLIEYGFIDFWKQIKKMSAHRNEWCEIHSKKTKKVNTKEGSKIYHYEYDETNLFFTLNIVKYGKNSGKVSKWFNNLLIRDNLKKTDLDEEQVFHCFRHTFASAIYNKNKGLSYIDIEKTMGWSTEGMTKVYIHPTLEKIKDIVYSVSYPKFERKVNTLLLPDKNKSKVFDK
ncbi:MAG: site-specific integrase [Alphaproteobacteria bacterium]|nr:site-specific integrase [Alphaproteobacteria bacterium]